MINTLHKPYWMDEETESHFEPVRSSFTVDTLIVGGGITGLTTAYCLALNGVKIAVAENRNIGCGDTGHTSAHLTCALDLPYSEIDKIHGRDNAKLILESHLSAISFIEELCADFDFPHFKRIEGRLLLNEGDDIEILEKELAILNELGLPAEIKTADQDDSWHQGNYLLLPQQGRFHVMHYLAALAQAITDHGGKIFSHTHIDEFAANKAVTSNGHVIWADSIVIASHSPVKAPLFFLKQAAYRTYVVASPVPKGKVHDALYWDTAEPYHYVRLEDLNESQDLLIIGGEDHKTGQPREGNEDDCFARLEDWAKTQYPFLEQFTHQWSGQVLEPQDGLAYIGKIPYRNYGVYMATGFSGNGMTYGTIAGRLLCDLILQRKNKWEKIYSPSRKTISSLSAGKFIHENINSAVQMAKDRLSSGDKISDRTSLQKGDGAILMNKGKNIALYRDQEGKLHSFSAVCPHLKCIVRWNSTENTFDCPCHGSRFSCTGEVLNGPSIENLKPIEMPEE